MSGQRLGLVGGGLMGAGIAINAARHKVQVLVYDLRSDGVDALRTRAASVYKPWIASGRMDEKQAQTALALSLRPFALPILRIQTSSTLSARRVTIHYHPSYCRTRIFEMPVLMNPRHENGINLL
jgi:hypothetical protein